MKITNIETGPRGLHGSHGPVVLNPGETVDVEMDAGEIASASRTGWFRFGEEDPVAPAPGDESTDEVPDIEHMKVDELKTFLTDRSIEIPDGVLKADLIALAIEHKDAPVAAQ